MEKQACQRDGSVVGTFASVQISCSLPLAMGLSTLWCACSEPSHQPDMTSPAMDHLVFEDLNGKTTALGLMEGTKATLYITLDPECPMTLGYAPLLDSLQVSLPPGVNMVGVYTGPFMVRDSAAAFARKQEFGFAQVMDPQCEIAGALRARVTPESFLVARGGNLLYHGALDNSAVREGRKRIATEHYLSDALSAFAIDAPQPLTEVKALGCMVECDNIPAP